MTKKTKTHIIMPVMRESYIDVLEDLCNQTVLVDELTIFVNVDIHIDFKRCCPFKINVIDSCQNKNIGTNAVWNRMFDFDSEFVGVVGDDYRIDPNAIDKLLRAFNKFPNIGAATAKIFQNQTFESYPSSVDGCIVNGKGSLGLALFRKCVLDCIPKIPEEFFVFYGDNWFSYWLNGVLKRPIYKINVGISHYHKTDLKTKVGYSSLIKSETRIWKNWMKGNIEL